MEETRTLGGVSAPRAAKKTKLARAAQTTELAPGVWDRVKAFFGIGAKDKKSQSDVPALRARAESLHQRLQSAGSDGAARLATLRATQTELYELVRDLLASGDQSPTLLELSNQVSGLAQVLAMSPPADDAINRSYEGTVLALRAWLGVPETPVATGREGFWK